jgi:quinoprotein glucose dehydrogenase
MRRLLIFSTSFLGLFGTLFSILAAPPEVAKPYEPKVHPASKEAEQAIQHFKLPKGMKAEVYAAEPLLANPVAFCFDEKGRCYVAETFRLHRGVTDNRDHMYWLDDDLASRTVADRVALYKKHLKDKFPTYETEHDRVRLLVDTKGTGKPDRATVFADGFHHAEDGIGAGVLAREGNLYYTCIPDLWLLKDTKGSGKADVRKSLASGFGVHVAFLGHDLHGLRMGPDGRLYFSCGDRGLNVKTKEGRRIFLPDTGAVLRCEPDGSQLEVVATGLRNPQHLAFDQYGNLFTCDNNSDSGDKARLVYIVEGGDSGWRTGYQYGSSLSDRGPFNAEKIWHLPHEGQPAYIVPPIAHVADGPSGFSYYPGTGLPERYAGHFFLSDFRGDPAHSGVRSFAVKPKGASFELVDQHEFIWGILATDCQFGPDGGFYISDWVHGWELTGKGRIYRFTDPEQAKCAAVKEVKKLLAEGFDKRPLKELAKLLEHPDMRVRQEAQFALADKGDDAFTTLTRVAEQSRNRLARLHAIWGIGQVFRQYQGRGPLPDAHFAAPTFFEDKDPEVRAQAARTWSESFLTRDFFPLLKDKEPRVRVEAALALSRMRWTERRKGEEGKLARALFDMLRDNADADPYIRHAGVMALASLRDPKAVLAGAKDESPAVRMGVLLALRRLESEEIARFLSDNEPRIALEAARAIHDVPIPAALPKLAAMVNKPNQPEFVLWRALNANLRAGKGDNAVAVAAFAARADSPEKLRIEAVRMLGDWAKPGRRDRVTGLTQDLGTRNAKSAIEALKKNLNGVFSGPDKLRQEAARTVAKLGMKDVGPELLALVVDKKSSPTSRVAAVQALDALRDERLDQAMKLALADPDPKVRTAGRRVLARVQPKEAIAALRDVLDKGTMIERQGALVILGDTKGAEVNKLLIEWLDRLLAGNVPAEMQLDLLEAGGKRQAKAIRDRLAKYEAARPKNDHLANYRETLVGGDAEAGRRIFFYKSEVSCLRCHKVKGEGGEVGPDLTGIGAKQKRDYLLESIVDPNRQIAKGFETVQLVLTNGQSLTGIIKEENAKQVRLITPEGKFVTVPKKDIEARESGKSAMPEDVIKHLSKSELRDLVEFLANLK